MHLPFSLPKGNAEASFHFMIWTGHISYLLSLPGMLRIWLVTSLICIRIHGILLSVGLALMSVSPSLTKDSSGDPGSSFRLLECNVHTMTRLVPRGSAIATTRAWAVRLFTFPASMKASTGPCGASPPLTTPPLNTTSSSELSSPPCTAGTAPACASSASMSASKSSSSTSRPLRGFSDSSKICTTTMSPCTALFRALRPLITISLSPKGKLGFFGSFTYAVLGFAMLTRNTPFKYVPF
mmetsp:Transcript_3487/g.8679  ORF Transcript_3487/g.8679 Transcript_3487/m.8679 type:complete len:239 (+) Transcript_3487:2031-2747(+)